MKTHEDPYPETDEFVSNNTPIFKLDDLVFYVQGGSIQKGRVGAITITKNKIRYTVDPIGGEVSVIVDEERLFSSFEDVIRYLRSDFDERYI
jgi:hypothetical protein